MEINMCENKCWCSICKNSIVVGQDFLVDYAYRSRTNVCFRCLIKWGDEVKKGKKSFEKLEKMTPKERREKVKLIKGLVS